MKAPKMIELTQDQLDQLLERVKDNALQPGDYELIKSIIDSHIYLKTAYENKTTSVKRLLRMLFGSSSEKKKKLIGSDDEKNDEPSGDDHVDPVNEDQADEVALDENGQDQNASDPDEVALDENGQDQNASDPDSEQNHEDTPEDDTAQKSKGHGRNGVGAFSGAEREFVEHPNLKHGDPCILCPGGKVYQKKPASVIRFFGQAPIEAKIWELERLRCNLCGAIFTAERPEQAQGPKYDETAIAMMAITRYGFGLPMNRLEKLQDCLQMPLAASTQWDKVESGADRIYPAFEQLQRIAAQGEVLHNDDTPMKILELMKINDDPENEGQRKGMQTTGILSITDDRKIAMFFTGRNHSGENVADLMSKRESEKDPPIQMCDALAANFSKYADIILANCNSHARRKFVYEKDNYPDQFDHALQVFETLYKNDAHTKKLEMSDQQRLEYHQKHSGPSMELFHTWLHEQFAQKRVEPNSGMGQAISYMLKHWDALTRFLHVPGVPLDNNVCEQMLKRAIMHRKNSLFYKTLHGAYIGDMYMSLIHTCVFNEANPFDYIVELQRHSSEVFKHPDQWMPWNYQQTLATLSESAPELIS